VKQTSLGWLTPVLAVIVPLLGLAGWELLQRHRFTAEADRLQAALRRFADSTSFPGEDGKPLPTASGRTSPPYFKLQGTVMETWRTRERTWTVGAVFVDRQGRWHPVRADLLLHQERKFLLRGPELLVEYGSSESGISRLLDLVLNDFDYWIQRE